MVTAETRSEIADAVEGRRQEAVDFLVDLVRTPSPNPPAEYGPIRSVLEGHFDDVGWDRRTVAPPDDVLADLGLSGERPNVLATPGAGDGPTLGLVAHFDTVPADAGEWTYDPFGATVEDGRLYGRGAKDCKARIATYALAVRALEDLSLLPSDLAVVVAATADEETGSEAGAKYLAESGEFRPEYAVLEGNVDRIWYATAGVRQFAVTIRGRSAHAGLDPERGANPLFGLEVLLPALRSLDAEFSEVAASIPGTTPPTCNPTMVDAGIKANVVPGSCTVTVDLRIPPDVDAEQVEARFRSTVSELSLPAGLSLGIDRIHSIDSYVGDSDGVLARAVGENAAEVRGRPVPMEGVMGPTDALWFGSYGCECVHYGPGDAESNQHAPDENVKLEQVAEAATVVAASVLDLAESLDAT